MTTATSYRFGHGPTDTDIAVISVWAGEPRTGTIVVTAVVGPPGVHQGQWTSLFRDDFLRLNATRASASGGVLLVLRAGEGRMVWE
jgi:hypothetical protein